MKDSRKPELGSTQGRSGTHSFFRFLDWVLIISSIGVVATAFFFALTALYPFYRFMDHILSVPHIGIGRWLLAGVVVAIGVYYNAKQFQWLLGAEEWPRFLRLIIGPALFIYYCAGIVLFGGVLWLFGIELPWYLAIFSSGPISIGQAFGICIGFMFFPLLFSMGIARGILITGLPPPRYGCEALQLASRAGLIDTHSLLTFSWQLTTLAFRPQLLRILQFEYPPPFWSLDWMHSLTIGSWLLFAGEAWSCVLI